jgi:hypothetical protein
MRLITELPRHPTDIYVVGSGSSLNYVNRSFFDGKVTIGINLAYRFFQITYGISIHTSLIPEMIARGVVGISPEWDMGIHGRKRVKMGNEVVFRHKNNTQYIYDERHTGYLDIDFSDFDNPEQLVIGGIASSAIHLAYRLGATSIILAGIDGGVLDGITNIRSYTPEPTEAEHIYEMQPQIDLVCNMIRSKGVGVYSLNPFTNFCLEGHTFNKSTV